MILQPPGERPTIYTNVYATSTSLVKKYLRKNSVRQNKVRTPFDPETLPARLWESPELPFHLRVFPSTSQQFLISSSGKTIYEYTVQMPTYQ